MVTKPGALQPVRVRQLQPVRVRQLTTPFPCAPPTTTAAFAMAGIIVMQSMFANTPAGIWAMLSYCGHNCPTVQFLGCIIRECHRAQPPPMSMREVSVL